MTHLETSWRPQVVKCLVSLSSSFAKLKSKQLYIFAAFSNHIVVNIGNQFLAAVNSAIHFDQKKGRTVKSLQRSLLTSSKHWHPK